VNLHLVAMFSSGRSSVMKFGPVQESETQPLVPKKLPEDEGLAVKGGGICGSFIEDYRRRFTLEQLQTDWVDDAFTWKTASSALCMFFSTFTASLALGEAVFESTKGMIGFNEFIIMNSVSGMVHAVFGCQPLLVLRPTGPIGLLIEKLLQVALAHALPFWPLFAWTGIFVGIFMFLIAIFRLSRYFHFVTPFADGILATFIGIVYINDGLRGMLTAWYSTGASPGSMEAARNLLTVNLTIVVTLVALWLTSMKSSKLFTFEFRSFVVSQALTIALFLAIVAAWWLDKYYAPMLFIDASKSGFVATASRPWVPDLLSLPPFGIMVAALSSVPVVMFLYLDQMIASAVCQSPDMKLQKGSYYNSSLGLVGILNFCGALVGLPFVTGSLPHSPQLVLSLTDYDNFKRPASVRENRLAPFLLYMFLGVPLLFPRMLSMIPKAAVNATLIFIGIQNMIGTSIFERVFLVFTETKHWPIDHVYSRVKPYVMTLYTGIQIGLVIGCWALTGRVGIAFPFLVASMVPFRWHVLPEWFSDDDLNDLEELEEEDDDSEVHWRAASAFRARSSVLSICSFQGVEDQQEADPEPGYDEPGYDEPGYDEPGYDELRRAFPPSPLDLEESSAKNRPVQEGSAVCARMISGPAYMDCSSPTE